MSKQSNRNKNRRQRKYSGQRLETDKKLRATGSKYTTKSHSSKSNKRYNKAKAIQVIKAHMGSSAQAYESRAVSMLKVAFPKPRYTKSQRAHLRSHKLSGRAKQTTGLISLRKAFKTIGADITVTRQNYKNLFRLFDDAQIYAGMRNYGQSLRNAAKLTDLGEWKGDMWELLENNPDIKSKMW